MVWCKDIITKFLLLPQVGERKWIRCLIPLLPAGVREENYPDVPAAVPLWDGVPASGSPWEGKGASVRDDGQSVLSYTHSPTTVHKGGEGWRNPANLASLAGEVSSKLRTLAAASCAACQNLLWGLSQTNFVQQWGSLSTGVASLSPLGTQKCRRIAAPSHTL